MVNPTLERLRRQAREAFARAAMHQRQGEAEEAATAKAFARRCEEAAKDIVDEMRARQGNRRGPYPRKG